jgi:hypothetical protein
MLSLIYDKDSILLFFLNKLIYDNLSFEAFEQQFFDRIFKLNRSEF